MQNAAVIEIHVLLSTDLAHLGNVLARPTTFQCPYWKPTTSYFTNPWPSAKSRVKNPDLHSEALEL